ncbi:MAG: response regulator transcription factor [Niameybacter sp.]
MEAYTILVVDDNPEIRDVVRILLSGEGYQVLEAEDGRTALAQVDESIDLIILDIMMPDKNGYKVCEEMRRLTKAPILFLTAKTQDSDKAMGFLAGGDDYLPKPFSYAELGARVKALLRRYYVYKGKEEKVEDAYLSLGELRINKEYNEVLRNGNEIDLTEIEYKLLLLMASHHRKIFSAQNLYESVWNEPYFYVSNGTIMVHIRKLRVKIEKDPQNPRHIKTVWGKGYRVE